MKNTRVWIDYTKVRMALSFEAVLNHYGIEYETGRNQIKINCPFHDDSDPSLSINLSENKWKCFGCGAKGNALEFVTKVEGYDPDDKEGLRAGALEAIAIMGDDPQNFDKKDGKKNGSKLGVTSTKKPRRPNDRNEHKKAEAADSEGKEGASEVKRNPVLNLKLVLDSEHPFLEGRGLIPETIEEFGIGYCNKGMMKNRIAIPIHDENGELVAYAGRYAEEEPPEGIARYKLPKKFRKSLVLYNLHRAKTFNKKHLVLVEGFWSVFRLHQAGIPVAALLGTSCSPEQAALISEAGFRFVTVLLDGDDAGRKGANEVLSQLGHHLYTRVVDLPEGVKPDDMPAHWLRRLR